MIGLNFNLHSCCWWHSEKQVRLEINSLTPRAIKTRVNQRPTCIIKMICTRPLFINLDGRDGCTVALFSSAKVVICTTWRRLQLAASSTIIDQNSIPLLLLRPPTIVQDTIRTSVQTLSSNVYTQYVIARVVVEKKVAWQGSPVYENKSIEMVHGQHKVHCIQSMQSVALLRSSSRRRRLAMHASSNEAGGRDVQTCRRQRRIKDIMQTLNANCCTSSDCSTIYLFRFAL